MTKFLLKNNDQIFSKIDQKNVQEISGKLLKSDQIFGHRNLVI